MNQTTVLSKPKSNLIQLSDQLESIFKNNSNPSIKSHKELLLNQPFKHTIQSNYGGQGIDVPLSLNTLEIASYNSIATTLMYGINMALFLQPLAKYGNNELKDSILSNYLSDSKMGGLMITEPNYGTDALNMQTTFEKIGKDIKITGVKHWQGLTGQADYWLVAGRMKVNNKLDNNISFCVVPKSHVEYKLFQTRGLHLIQYGENHLNCRVPSINLLNQTNTQNEVIQDILNRSRLQFSGMAVGFIKRNKEIVELHCNERKIRRKNLNKFKTIQNRLQLLQIFHTITHCLTKYSSLHSGIELNLSSKTIIANIVKTTVSELMRQSAEINIQLSGGNSFLANHFGFNSYIDTRPFLIFEGPNDMLLNQIGRMVILDMRKKNIKNLVEYICKHLFDTSHDSEQYKDLTFHYEVDFQKTGITDYTNSIAKLVRTFTLQNLVQRFSHIDFSRMVIENTLIYLQNKLNYELFKIKNQKQLKNWEPSCHPTNSSFTNSI